MHLDAMIISCPACGTRYAVPETAIGPEGRTVRCAKCKNSWFQESEPLELGQEAERQPEAPPAPDGPAPDGPVVSNKPASQVTPGPSVDHWRSEEPETSSEPETPPHSEPEPEAKPEAKPEQESFAGTVDPLASSGEGEDGDDRYYDDADNAFGDDDYEDDYEEDTSSFDYRPPFTRRRNSLKMWTIAAGVFAMLATGTVLAANYYGLPDWLPIQRPEFGIGKSDLELDFPADRQRKEVLESGEEIFQVRGSISNVGQESETVPSLLIVFRDAREKNVYSWVVVPSKRELAPGESLNVTEAITDIPPAAQAAEIGWSPN